MIASVCVVFPEAYLGGWKMAAFPLCPHMQSFSVGVPLWPLFLFLQGHQTTIELILMASFELSDLFQGPVPKYSRTLGSWGLRA